MSKSKKPYQYGKDPAPKDWYQAADAITSLQPKKKGPGLSDRLASIEDFIKSQQKGNSNGN